MFRSILDRLIYNDCYYTVDQNLTDGNVGARKERNIRDNIFVLGAVSNSVVHGQEDAIQVQVQDAVNVLTNCGWKKQLMHYMKQG